jgi:hypothetical protein
VGWDKNLILLTRRKEKKNIVKEMEIKNGTGKTRRKGLRLLLHGSKMRRDENGMECSLCGLSWKG